MRCGKDQMLVDTSQYHSCMLSEHPIPYVVPLLKLPPIFREGWGAVVTIYLMRGLGHRRRIVGFQALLVKRKKGTNQQNEQVITTLHWSAINFTNLNSALKGP